MAALEKYINVDGSLEASKIEEDWFTPIRSHIFLSHSHDDEEMVKQLAGYLKHTYALIKFAKVIVREGYILTFGAHPTFQELFFEVAKQVDPVQALNRLSLIDYYFRVRLISVL